MAFLGYYAATSANITAVSNPPMSNVTVGDTIIAIWQDPETYTRTAKTFTYSTTTAGSPHWEETGNISTVVSFNTELLPLEGRYLTNLDPNGLGMFATNYAYVDANHLETWGTTNQVGQDTLADADDLEIHDIFTGQVVSTMPSTLGLLPIYIRSNGVVAGVGSAVYSYQSWIILWYKMALAAGAAPRAVYDTATVISTQTFKMAGDTTSFKLRLYITDAEYHDMPGNYDGGYTTYDFSSHTDWTFFTLTDAVENIVYQSRKGLYDASFQEVSANGPLHGLNLTDAMARINTIFTGGYAVTIDHNVT